MGEWLKPAVLKTVSGVTRSGVRIPLPPPDSKARHILSNVSALSASGPHSYVHPAQYGYGRLEAGPIVPPVPAEH